MLRGKEYRTDLSHEISRIISLVKYLFWKLRAKDHHGDESHEINRLIS